jgi:BirA family biotin operon repressor/biotin-[acetyl-CoA-carboxylase] ligase
MTSGPHVPASELVLLGALLRSPAGVDLGFLRWEYRFSADDVAQIVARLRTQGCDIVPAGPSSYRLRHSGLEVWQEYLACALGEEGIKRKVIVYRQTPSTQDIARQQTETPVAVLADHQTAGRGRLGRRWLAPPGTSILLSMTHLCSADDDSPDCVQCIAAVAVAQALERLTGRNLIQIKWPNDLVVAGRKLAGILVETFDTGARGRMAVIGVGINIAPPPPDSAALPAELRSRIVCLRDLGCQADRLHVAAQVIIQVDRLLASPQRSLLLDEWRCRNLMRDQRVVFQSDGRRIAGEVVDLDYRDGLIVRTDEGELVHLHAATTTVLES